MNSEEVGGFCQRQHPGWDSVLSLREVGEVAERCGVCVCGISLYYFAQPPGDLQSHQDKTMKLIINNKKA